MMKKFTARNSNRILFAIALVGLSASVDTFACKDPYEPAQAFKIFDNIGGWFGGRRAPPLHNSEIVVQQASLIDRDYHNQETADSIYRTQLSEVASNCTNFNEELYSKKLQTNIRISPTVSIGKPSPSEQGALPHYTIMTGNQVKE